MLSSRFKVGEVVRYQVRRTCDDREVQQEIIVRIAHRRTPKKRQLLGDLFWLDQGSRLRSKRRTTFADTGSRRTD
jgi:hypothetical protein